MIALWDAYVGTLRSPLIMLNTRFIGAITIDIIRVFSTHSILSIVVISVAPHVSITVVGLACFPRLSQLWLVDLGKKNLYNWLQRSSYASCFRFATRVHLPMIVWFVGFSFFICFD